MENLKRDLLVAESCMGRACSFPPLETDSLREGLSSSLPAPKDFSFLGPTLTKPQSLPPVPFHTSQTSQIFKGKLTSKIREIKRKIHQEKNPKQQKKKPTNAHMHMNKKREVKQNKIK